jgi:hypothetical protein
LIGLNELVSVLKLSDKSDYKTDQMTDKSDCETDICQISTKNRSKECIYLYARIFLDTTYFEIQIQII